MSVTPSRYDIQGHAIISDDDRIADASGQTPPALRKEADWVYFQGQLDRAAVTVLGRLGHEANPNPKNRTRLIVSHGASGVERREDGWWWNPSKTPLADALQAAAPGGGIVAVPGGQGIFDLFLTLGYDEFHLTRAHGVTVGAGRSVFSACTPARSAEDVLSQHGLNRAEQIDLDPADNLSLSIWRRGPDRL